VAGIDVMVVTGPRTSTISPGSRRQATTPFRRWCCQRRRTHFVVRQLEYFNFIANTFIANAEIYQDGDQPVNFR